MMLADDRKVTHQAIHTDTVNSQERNVVLDDRHSTMNYSERTYVYCVKIFAHIKCYSVRSRRGGGASHGESFATVLFNACCAVTVEWLCYVDFMNKLTVSNLFEKK